jgi:hypothetical protein
MAITGAKECKELRCGTMKTFKNVRSSWRFQLHGWRPWYLVICQYLLLSAFLKLIVPHALTSTLKTEHWVCIPYRKGRKILTPNSNHYCLISSMNWKIMTYIKMFLHMSSSQWFPFLRLTLRRSLYLKRHAPSGRMIHEWQIWKIWKEMVLIY